MKRTEASKQSSELIRSVCRLAGSVTYIEDLRHEAAELGLVRAVAEHDSAAIFDWLMRAVSYQGISDAAVDGFIREHGNVTWQDIETRLQEKPECEKLTGHWTFRNCAYVKSTQTCASAECFPTCPLPGHQLRNGRLNQTAYSLFFFIRDVANGDIVSWIDQQIVGAANPQANLIDPFRSIFGISDKIIAMVISVLLMGTGRERPGWFEAGETIMAAAVRLSVHAFRSTPNPPKCLILLVGAQGFEPWTR